MATTVNVILDNSSTTVNVVMTGGIIQTSSSLLVISGFIVKKGSGNTAATIEVGDYITGGWIGDVWLSGKVTTIPVNDVSDINPAVQGEVIT